VPRGGNVQRYFSDGDIDWTIVLLRQVSTNYKGIFAQARAAGTGSVIFNGKTYEQRGIKLNELLWNAYKKIPVFHCPQRERDSGVGTEEVVSYIVNAFNPKARTGGSGFADTADATKITIWKHPASVVYLADLEKSSVAPTVAAAYSVPGTKVGDLSYFDAFDPSHLPSASHTSRRVARAMHLKRVTNSLFVDGHSESLDALPRSGEPNVESSANGTYSLRWQRYFGVEIP
ncbi:MAG: hypothetical protein HY718_02745, partial [Planctomycetes bacterium]|nr:hypothetical protein [Planctomycetota bacterium]